MASYFKMHILGLHILLLMNLTQSFVLLTANMEDVRKLAKKFVSESLAEQIADFIAKVSTNDANVSEENEKNIDLFRQSSVERSNKISRDDELSKYKLASINQRSPNNDDKPQRGNKPTKRNTYVTLRHTTAADKIWSQYNREERPRADKYRYKHTGRKDKEGTDNAIAKAIKKTVDVYFENMNGAGENPEGKLNSRLNTQRYGLKNAEADNIKSNFRNKPKEVKAKKYSASNRESNTGYKEKAFDNIPNPGRYSFNQAKSDEIKKTNKKAMAPDNNLTEKSPPRFAGFNIASSIVLTTEKEKNEFDQYDNNNYQKSQFVATSGPVNLPKIKPELLLNLEGTEKKDIKKKAWF